MYMSSLFSTVLLTSCLLVIVRLEQPWMTWSRGLWAGAGENMQTGSRLPGFQSEVAWVGSCWGRSVAQIPGI